MSQIDRLTDQQLIELVLSGVLLEDKRLIKELTKDERLRLLIMLQATRDLRVEKRKK